ncbi:MAG: Fe-S cluster assembly protein SufD [Candidatus Marinimicrobia bacterium]|nr:Fe-S cluster assembly protein SufD [Candidatus Neomarinimicrobiota bacterium]
MAQQTNNFSNWISQQIEADTTFTLSDAVRSPSRSRLAEGIFPTRKDEEWRYTPLGQILESSPDMDSRSAVTPEFINKLKDAMPQAHTLVFINGQYSENFSDNQTHLENAGLRISRFSQLNSTQLQMVEETILNAALTDDNIFQHITLGLAQNGLFIELAQNVDTQTTLHIIHISSAQGDTSFTNPVQVVRCGENSHLKMVEQFTSLGQAAVITVPASYIQMDKGAGLVHYKIGIENNETNHVSNTSVRVAESGTYQSHQYLLGSKLTRSNLEVSFTGPDGHAVLRGIYLGDENQHLDMRTYMDHAHPHCSSDQHFRGILNGHARGVFNGMVLVRKDAQKTDAQQTNKNLLLSRDARVDTKPQLEIFADDVKCAHGATIGELDPDALFYLQSRGIGKKDAALMLTRAFAAEISQEIELISLQDYLQDKIAASLNEIVNASI